MAPLRAALLAVTAAVLPALAAPAHGQAKTGDPRVDGARPLRLTVGERVNVCETGTIMCPAEAPICDDPKVATWSFEAEGLVFTGVGPGETLCSAGSANRLRQVYRVIVAAREPA